MPVAGLLPAGPRQYDDRGSHCRTEKNAAMPPRGYSVGDEPGQENIQTDLWEVCVTIRVSLRADLYDAAHRYQHSQKPKPASQKIGMFPSIHQSGRADCEEQ
jgi:hypothetical protein